MTLKETSNLESTLDITRLFIQTKSFADKSKIDIAILDELHTKMSVFLKYHYSRG